jgi:leucyl-tRNA synthetase
MVLAPEHELVEQLTSEQQKPVIDEYLKYVQSRSDVDRQAEKMVTGAFTGSYCIHPFTRERIPIYIAEYVLSGYGTGAIMAVPHGDERDHAFASKFRLPIIEVVDQDEYPNATREEKVGKMVNSDFLDGLSVRDAIKKAIEALEEKGVGERKINFKLRDAGFSRQRYWGEPFPVVYKNDVPQLLPESDLPVELPEVDSFKPAGDGRSPLAKNESWTNLPDGSVRETDTMPGYAGSSWYFLRFMDPHNDKVFVGADKEDYWRNVDMYMGGSEHAVGHLMYARMWQKVLFDLGLVHEDEPFKRLINQGMIQGRSNFVYRIKDSNTFVSRGLKGEYKTTAIHVDISLVKDDTLDVEAFKNWREDFKDAEFILEEGKYFCGYEVEKMSKSKYNVINPDDIVERYGADCFRMYEMFLGPIEQSKPWDTQGIDGVAKFLNKFWRLFFDQEGNWQVNQDECSEEAMRVLHQTIKKVDEDIERFAFNTCVSQFMICVNELTKMNCHSEQVLKPLVKALAPFAPFISSELWERLGEGGLVVHQSFPQHEEKYLKADTIEYPVSINGKMRTKLKLPAEIDSDSAKEAAMSDEVVQKWVDGKDIRKFIFVPGRIINIVV